MFKVGSDDEAISLANDSQYGLGGSIISENLERAEKVASKIDTGMIFINEFTKSDHRIPYGGVKSSGYGWEFGEAGIREFTNQKPYWFA